MRKHSGIKKLVLFCVGAGACIWLVLAGFNYYRESHALASSGTGLSRASVDLIYKNEASVHFGADSTTEFVFSLPNGVSGINWCGQQGYSGAGPVDLAEILKLPGAPQDKAMGCVRHVTTDYGRVTTYVLLESRIIIKLMV